MKIKELFASTYVRFINSLKVFDQKDVQAVVTWTNDKYAQDPLDIAPFVTRFTASTNGRCEMIFDKDADVLNCGVVGFLEMPSLYAIVTDQLSEEEKEGFWVGLSSLVRFHAMVLSCGDHLETIEALATNFWEKNQDLKSNQFHTALFSEMLSGGELSKGLMKSFSEPSQIKLITEHLPNIARGSGVDVTMLSDLLTRFSTDHGEEAVLPKIGAASPRQLE
jgi:hypothetical protein